MKNSRSYFRLFLMVRYLFRLSFERISVSPTCLQPNIYRNIGILFQCLLDGSSVVILLCPLFRSFCSSYSVPVCWIQLAAGFGFSLVSFAADLLAALFCSAALFRL